MLQKKFPLVVAILMAALLTLTLTSVTPLVRAAPPSQTLNIGVIGPFDGPTAEGVTLALQRFSAQGPFTTPDGATYTLAVITADATTPQEVSTAITQLKRQNAIAIFGPPLQLLFQTSSMTQLAKKLVKRRMLSAGTIPSASD